MLIAMKTSWRYSQNLLAIQRHCLRNMVNSHIPLGHEDSIPPFTAIDRLRKARSILPTSVINLTINLNSHHSKAIFVITTNEGF